MLKILRLSVASVILVTITSVAGTYWFSQDVAPRNIWIESTTDEFPRSNEESYLVAKSLIRIRNGPTIFIHILGLKPRGASKLASFIIIFKNNDSFHLLTQLGSMSKFRDIDSNNNFLLDDVCEISVDYQYEGDEHAVELFSYRLQDADEETGFALNDGRVFEVDFRNGKLHFSQMKNISMPSDKVIDRIKGLLDTDEDRLKLIVDWLKEHGLFND